MKIKQYCVSIYSKATHKCIDEVQIISDGYLGALVEASKHCKQHYSNAYVGSVHEKGS